TCVRQSSPPKYPFFHLPRSASVFFFFFFSSRRRHTRFKCDWSSDVCSSEIRSAVTDERQRQTLVRQERCRDADVHCCLQRQKRNYSTTEQHAEAIFGVQRDHHPANDDDDKQKDDEQADA